MKSVCVAGFVSFVLWPTFLNHFAAAAPAKTMPNKWPQRQQPQATQYELNWTKRTEWQAQEPRHITAIINGKPSDTNTNLGVAYVIIHHTATPQCHSKQQCSRRLQSMQRAHMIDRGWDDIGYNFVIGGDGDAVENLIYEGRGFNVSGAHAPGYNQRSLGIAFIGNWTDTLPPQNQLDALNKLINFGIQHGYIQSQYTLLGHRQVKATACPGARLYQELKKWTHFKEKI